MRKIKVKTPAKINLTLEVLNRREDGFHNIQSIMQTISLYDYLTFEVSENNGIEIILNGTSDEIPYNEKNLVYKAALKFLEVAKIENVKINIFIEKNIPVSAGLAGGSTNAAGTFFALNKLFDNVLSKEKIEELCASMGSDLNFCLNGGCMLCTSRGEKLENLDFEEFDLCLVKPKNLQISAREAYLAFDDLKEKSTMPNDLEFALLDKYNELKFLNSLGLQMSGSGPTYFIKQSKLNIKLDDNYQVIENLKAINTGICAI